MRLAALPSAWRWPVVILWSLAVIALAAQAVVYCHYAWALFCFPFDYDQGEGFELYDTFLHVQGQWPYRDSQVFPFYTSIYPPLFHLLVAPLVWVFGPHLWTGRVVGFLASLIVAAAIGWGVQRDGQNRLIALVAALLFLASNYTFHIGPLFRQHMTMVMFETLAVVSLAQLDRRGGAERPWRRSWPFWLGMLALLAAGYTKQMAVTTVLAAMAFLFLRGPRRAVVSGLALAAVAAGLFGLINHLTGGWWYTSIIAANINAYSLDQALAFYRQWGELHLIIIGAAIACGIYEIYWGRISIYTLWFIFAVAGGALAGKVGAGESYFVTATAAACLVGGRGVARLWAHPRLAQVPWAVVVALGIPALCLVQTRLTLHLYTDGPIYGALARLLGVSAESGYYDSQGYTQLGPRPTAADVAAGWTIVQMAQAAPGPVFSEEAAFMFHAGKPVVTNPFPQKVMYEAGLFDPAQEIALINAKVFGLVILRAQFYPPPVLMALGANYQPRADIPMNGFIYRILEPRP